EGQRVNLFLARQQEKLSELLAEERLTWRVIETQRRQRIDDTIVAGVAAVEGFYTNNRNDHFGRHAVGRFGAGKRIFVLPAEIDTLRDTRISAEDWTIFLPGLASLGRPRNCIKDVLFALRLGQHFCQLFAGKAIALGHLLDEFGYF